MSDNAQIGLERPFREPIHRLEPGPKPVVHAWTLRLYNAAIGVSTALNWDPYFNTILPGGWASARIQTLGGELMLPHFHAYPWRAELLFESKRSRRAVVSLLTSVWEDGGTNVFQLSINDGWANYSASATVGFTIRRGRNRIAVICKDVTNNPQTGVLGRFLEALD